MENKGQSIKYSFLESFTNTILGYIIGVMVQMWIFPLYGVNISVFDNMFIVAVFTTISFIRTYLLRRFFNLLSK